MRFTRFILLLLAASILLQGCKDRMDLEDTTLSLLVGIDLDEHNQLLFYSSSPVFSKEAAKKTEEFGVRSSTLRFARDGFDAVATALTSKGKVQVVLLGKKVLEHEEWFPLLDVMFRDAKSTLNAKVALVDGPVEEFINYYPKDKPRLPLHMTKLIETASRRNITVRTSLADLHRQLFEKGITPSITEMRMEKHLEIVGTALLNKQGKYTTTLLLQETELLQMLRDDKKGQLSLTIPITEQPENALFHTNRASFYVDNFTRKIQVGYAQERFTFQINLKLSALLTERLFPYDMKTQTGKLEQEMKKQLEKRCNGVIAKLQKYKVDPIGLGMYARGYQYKAWKKVQDDWPDAVSRAEIKCTVQLKLLNSGLIK